MQNREALTEFQTLSKCLTGLLVVYDSTEEPQNQRLARENLAHATMARMQVLLEQLSSPEAAVDPIKLGTRVTERPGECDNSALPYQEAPLVVKGEKAVPPPEQLAAEAARIHT